MKFQELNKNEKHYIVKEYLAGWEEMHDKDDLSYSDAYNILSNHNDDVFLHYHCPICGVNWSEIYEREYGFCDSECPQCETHYTPYIGVL